MPNGKAGDHPLTDILVHHLGVYGEETDDLIRKIARLSSRRELGEWWEKEIGWNGARETAHEKAHQRYTHLLRRADQSGWGIRLACARMQGEGFKVPKCHFKREAAVIRPAADILEEILTASPR